MNQDDWADVAHHFFMLKGATDETICKALRQLHDENVDENGVWLE